jgi:hypothetical protein
MLDIYSLVLEHNACFQFELLVTENAFLVDFSFTPEGLHRIPFDLLSKYFEVLIEISKVCITYCYYLPYFIFLTNIYLVCAKPLSIKYFDIF